MYYGSFGDLEKTKDIGEKIVECLEKHKIKVKWNGKPEMAIEVLHHSGQWENSVLRNIKKEYLEYDYWDTDEQPFWKQYGYGRIY